MDALYSYSVELEQDYPWVAAIVYRWKGALGVQVNITLSRRLYIHLLYFVGYS